MQEVGVADFVRDKICLGAFSLGSLYDTEIPRHPRVHLPASVVLEGGFDKCDEGR